MPSDRTMVTELGTALGMLGSADVDEALESRSAVMHSLSPEMWDRLRALRHGGGFEAEFHAAFENGRAFLFAQDGLRGRLPRIVEWKGTGRAPGDEVAPIDLRVDHVYLISCKYLSNILFNVSPTHVFDDLLVGGQSRGRAGGREVTNGAPDKGVGGGDWYAEVAPLEYQALYDEVRRALQHAFHADVGVLAHAVAAGERPWSGRAGGPAPALPGFDHDAAPRAAGAARPEGASAPSPLLRSLPERATDLSSESRDALADWLKGGWPADAKAAYHRLAERVSFVSVHRWQQAMDERGGGTGESLFWRLLRMGSAPYFVLGSSTRRSLRLRIATPWDWRTHFSLGGIWLSEQPGGQPRVGWQAVVRERTSNELHELAGHIEVRWSHGRFGGPPEAKGYLDTAHHLVPGYFSLQ